MFLAKPEEGTLVSFESLYGDLGKSCDHSAAAYDLLLSPFIDNVSSSLFPASDCLGTCFESNGGSKPVYELF